jgi:exodeoxyribonuclease-3
MLRIMSFNANGIRSAAKKGFFEWLQGINVDIVCVQEVRAHAPDRTHAQYAPAGYYCYYQDAEKKGYSGVAIYSRIKPDRVHTTLGWDSADREGRYLQLDFGDLSVVSLYLPSGTSGEARQAIKCDWMDQLLEKLKTWRASRRSYIVCGDWNIAHKTIDLKNWRSNQKNSGFLPEERAWLDRVFDTVGYVDAFRVVNTLPDQYTWWSHRGQAAANNVGWRIDYHIVTPDLKGRIQSARIVREPKFSDHAPLILEYDFTIMLESQS